MERSDATTLIEADATLPVPAFAELTLPVVFIRVPTAIAVTFTEKWHELFAGIVPFDRTTEVALVVTVPEPQEPVRPFGVATASPAGMGSVNATPLSAVFVFEFAMVKVSEVDPPRLIVDVPNALEIEGASPTEKFAAAVLPVPPLVEVMALVVLVYAPGVELVTSTLTVHATFAGIEPPERLMVPVPAVAPRVPPQEPVRLLGEATTMPAGKLSVNATPKSVTVFAAGLAAVKVSVEVPFGAIRLGVKALASDGGATTATEADAVEPVPPAVELTLPVVLFFAPAVVPVTLTEKVHEPLAAIVPPERLIAPEPAVAVIVPAPQLPVRPFGEETTKPAGRASVKATPAAAVVVLEF
jgi:hypothetical protein